MKLFGSVPSPYVRRVRILLHGKKHEFIPFNVMSDEGQKLIKQYTPIRRVPLLVDGENTIWDSYLICKYLSKENLSLDDEKILMLINEAGDSGIHLLQLSRFDLDANRENGFSKNHENRMHEILAFLEESKLFENNKNWNLKEQWLYCLLDWINFRNVIQWEEACPGLKGFLEQNQDRESVKATDPRI